MVSLHLYWMLYRFSSSYKACKRKNQQCISDNRSVRIAKMIDRNVLFAAVAVILLPLITCKEVGCDSPKPDFKATGRRISEEKCHEYNWERKKLEQCSKETARIEYPYMGVIGFKSHDEKVKGWSFLCGAFLISPKFAVTAGHCTQSNRDGDTPAIVRFGNSDIKADVPRVDAKILRAIAHPEFRPPKKAFDIGLIELEEPLPWSSSVQPVCLWTQPSLQNIKTSIAPGWGTGSHKVHEIGARLAVMTVKILDKNTCEPIAKKIFNRHWQKIEDYQICGNETDSAVYLCLGSAGVPLITKGKLGDDEVSYALGVTSFGQRCPGLGVYTGVSSFLDWIEQTVWP